MSRKLLMFCLTMLLATAFGNLRADPPHVPLGNAIIRSDANAAKNPQSEGLNNANARQRRNQARFVDKHFGPRSAAAPERVERAERVERPERTERVERPERVERAERLDRPGLGKGR